MASQQTFLNLRSPWRLIVRLRFLGGSILQCNKNGDLSLGRFSQIWLQVKYENKFN
jgi:hypothetical protein